MEDLGELVGSCCGIEPCVVVVASEDDGHAFVERSNDFVGGGGDDTAARNWRLVVSSPGVGDSGEIELFAVRECELKRGFAAPFVKAVSRHDAATMENALAEGRLLQNGLALGVDDGSFGPIGLQSPSDFFGDQLAANDVNQRNVLGGSDVIAFFEENLERLTGKARGEAELFFSQGVSTAHRRVERLA